MASDDHLKLNLPDVVHNSIKQVYERLTSFTNNDFITDELYLPSTHLLQSRGKMIRPTMVLLGAHILNYSLESFVDLASAIELLHVSSLVHDDIIDKERERRGVDSVNYKFNNNYAILAGDALISKAIQLSSKYGSNVMYSISDAAMKMCAGESIDYKYQNNISKIDVDKYIKIAILKTASLIGTSSSIAAIYKDHKSKINMYDYGLNLGIAFQIRDDILEFTQSTSTYASKKAGKEANIVNILKLQEKISKKEAISKAISMNNKYVLRAISGIKEIDLNGMLSNYANLILIKE